MKNNLNLFSLIIFSLTAFSQRDNENLKTFRCFTEDNHEKSVQEGIEYAGRSLYCDTMGNYRKFIRVNVHWVLTDAGTGNFRANDDGNGNPFVTGYTKAEEMINMANNELLNHSSMWLPNPNNTPRLPTGIGFVLNGVYFVNSTVARNANNNNWNVHNTFGKDKSNTINIYMLENSIYDGGGIACNIGMNCTYGPAVKLYGTWAIYNSFNPDWTTFKSRLLQHEIGHLLNLYHSWSNDDCYDTPNHNNCWDFNPNNPNCNSWSKISNNIMDYNGFTPAAWSPCQIAKATQQITNSVGEPFIYNCSDCVPALANFTIGSNFCGGNIPMDCRGSFQENNYLIEVYKTNSSSGTYVIPGSYFVSWYSGQAPLVNLNSIYTPGFTSGLYRVKLAVQNFRPDNSFCNAWDEEVKYFTICAYGGGGGGGGGSGKTDSLDFIADEKFYEFLPEFNIYPNPGIGNFTLQFSSNNQSEKLVRVTDLSGRTILERNVEKGSPIFSLEVNLSGTFLVTVNQNSFSATKKIVVIK